MKRFLPALIGLSVVGGLCWLFPPFRLHSLQSVREAQMEAGFDVEDFARRFWAERLLPAATQSVQISKVLEAIQTDPKSVRERYGRTVGVSSSYFLFVHGTGQVVSTDDDRVELSVTQDKERVEVVIPLGFVFGNAVRDGSGLLDPSDYPNAQEFNDVSAALNSMVETNVLPRLQEIATNGTRIRFAGCAEVADEEADLKPIALVPISVEPD